MTTAEARSGRVNQRARTRTAIVDATRDLIRTGAEITMPAVARAALVSEATAYRYFPDLMSLLREAMSGMWPSPEQALAAVADSPDPVERVAGAADVLFRRVLAAEGAVRAMISASITRPELAATRPGYRFGLIDLALEPLAGTLGAADPAGFAMLKTELAIVVSAEALFTLTDLCGLAPEAAIASAVAAARTITAAACGRPGAAAGR
jgi:AcrR family transcriptional regulator